MANNYHVLDWFGIELGHPLPRGVFYIPSSRYSARQPAFAPANFMRYAVNTSTLKSRKCA
jgi:hypothetical protein